MGAAPPPVTETSWRTFPWKTVMKYRREPSVRAGGAFKLPSFVTCVKPMTLADDTGHLSQTTSIPTTITTAARSTAHLSQENRWAGASVVAVVAAVTRLDPGAFPESVSRFSRWRSVRTSEACWYRRLRSFSNALLMISSSLGGISGFNLVRSSSDSTVAALMATIRNEDVRGLDVPVDDALRVGGV